MRLEHKLSGYVIIAMFWGFVIVGFFIIFYFLYIQGLNYPVASEGDIDMNATGQTGDFIGGIVGTIWTLASMVLIYQTYKIQLEIKQTQETQYIENQVVNLYFKLIEDFQNIKFKDESATRIAQLAEVVNKLDSFAKEDNKSNITDYFQKRPSRATNKVAKLLSFILLYIYRQPQEVNSTELLKHLSVTTTTDEKVILFYYYCCFPKELYEFTEKYKKSEMIPENPDLRLEWLEM